MTIDQIKQHRLLRQHLMLSAPPKAVVQDLCSCDKEATEEPAVTQFTDLKRIIPK